MANVLGTLFGEIATAIREKSGETGKMKPAEFPAKIAAIEGGSSADVRYVTFMSYDGTVEYGKIPVAIGYDCPTPKFDTPTRESTAQYNYTFYGWADTPNGGADANWYKSITEDKIVYAHFKSEVRSYTITYLDSDGSTVLKTESLAYGSQITYEPTSDDYLFVAWSPEPTEVTGDATYTASWKPKPQFSTMSWDEIAAVCEAGNAASVFKIGDTKTIPMRYWGKKSYGSGYYGPFGPQGEAKDVEFQIVGFNMEDKEDGTKAAITIASTYALSYAFFGVESYDDLTVADKGWENSVMRSGLNDNAITDLPSDLQAVIKPVKKISNAANSNSAASNVTTIDKLWVPSSTEYNLSSSYTATGQGRAYSRLNSIRITPGFNTSGALVGDTSNNSENINHRTRSDSSYHRLYCMYISFRGTLTGDAGCDYYARMCFCI